MTTNREAWAEPDGRVTFSLPLSDGTSVTLNMSAAQADRCGSDLLSAAYAAQVTAESNDGR